MKFVPLHDRILVRRFDAKDKTPGGLIIPDAAKEQQAEGEIISVGKGKILENGNVRPLELKQGDYILFGKYSGTEIKIDGNPFVIMREEEVIGTMVGEKNKVSTASAFTAY